MLGLAYYRVMAKLGDFSRYWNDPDVLKKLSDAMGPGWANVIGAEADEGEEDDADEEVTDVHDAASKGKLASLHNLPEAYQVAHLTG